MNDFYSISPVQEIVRTAYKTPLGQFVKMIPKSSDTTSYDQLSLSEADKQNIAFIVETIATNSKISLLFKQGELRERGNQILHVHPLKFLSTIFTQDELTGFLSQLFSDYFKKTSFMDGLVEGLNREQQKGKLNQHICSFAKEIKVPHEEIKGYFYSNDWEGLVKKLIEIKS
jgi:hypothetical protein